MYYDPMIAKLITHGDTRNDAIARMQDALDAYYIRGLSHNISFLNAVISSSRFREGRLSTGFIAEEYPHGFHPSDLPRENPDLLIALAAIVHRRFMDRAAQLSGQLPSHERKVGADFVVIVNRAHHPVHVLPAEGGFEVRVGTTSYHVVTAWQMGQPLLKAEVNGHRACVQVDRVGLRYRLFHRGSQIDTLVVTPAHRRHGDADGGEAGAGSLEVPAVADAGAAEARWRSGWATRSRRARNSPWSKR